VAVALVAAAVAAVVLVERQVSEALRIMIQCFGPLHLRRPLVSVAVRLLRMALVSVVVPILRMVHPMPPGFHQAGQSSMSTAVVVTSKAVAAHCLVVHTTTTTSHRGYERFKPSVSAAEWGTHRTWHRTWYHMCHRTQRYTQRRTRRWLHHTPHK
jgi:hypothetical protein